MPTAPAEWRLDPLPEFDPLLESLVLLGAMLGRPSSAESLVAGLKLANGRLTPELFTRAAQRAGISARVAKVGLAEISALLLPCIVLLQGGRACILLKLSEASATVVLPEAGGGAADVPVERLQSSYTGHAIFARPDLAGDEPAARSPRAEWFASALRRLRGISVQVAAVALLTHLFSLVLPLFAMVVLDHVLTAGRDELTVLVLGALGAVVIAGLLRGIRAVLIGDAVRRAGAELDSQVCDQALGSNLDAAAGSLIRLPERVLEFARARHFLIAMSLGQLIDLPLTVVFFAAIAIIAGPLVFVPAAAFLLFGTLLLALRPALERLAANATGSDARQHAHLLETLAGLETAKAFGLEGRRQAEWERLAADGRKTDRRLMQILNLFQIGGAVLSGIAVVAVLTWGAREAASGSITAGALVAAAALSLQALSPLLRVGTMMIGQARARAAVASIDSVMALPNETRSRPKSVLAQPPIGTIGFEDVRFSYPGQDRPALAGVSFAIKPGERVALIGRGGAGKSAILRLLLALYRHQHGTISIDGVDIRRFDPVALRRNIGYVPQEIFLFAATVRDNIGLGSDSADEAAITEAARVAGVESFATLDPRGMAMPVGERGLALSAGQRQMVALARALVRRANLLLLDEPSSAIDQGSEDRLIGNLQPVLDGKTLVLATQRLPMLALVERVIVLDAGSVVADGPRDQILRSLAAGSVLSAG
jgi:ATP-binding cassette subfamily C protein LapB